MIKKPNTTEDKLLAFKELIEQFELKHGSFDAKACLKCIEIAKAQMESGKYSVESFLKAKTLLIDAVKCDSLLN